MSEAPLIIGLVLLAVLVGALLPVFYHAVQTLKSVRQFMETTTPRLEQALREITDTTARLNRIGATLEGEGARLKPLVDSAASLGQTLVGLRRSLHSAGTILTALGPAFLAGLGAFVARGGRSGDGSVGDDVRDQGAAEEAGAGEDSAPMSSEASGEEPPGGH